MVKEAAGSIWLEGSVGPETTSTGNGIRAHFEWTVRSLWTWGEAMDRLMVHIVKQILVLQPNWPHSPRTFSKTGSHPWLCHSSGPRCSVNNQPVNEVLKSAKKEPGAQSTHFRLTLQSLNPASLSRASKATAEDTPIKKAALHRPSRAAE